MEDRNRSQIPSVIGNRTDIRSWPLAGATEIALAWWLFSFAAGAQAISYTVIDPPGSTYTTITGVSGDEIVGVGSSGYGFIYKDGVYTTLSIQVDGDASPAVPTGVSGSNVVGTYTNAGGQTVGFLYNGQTDSTLDVPMSNETSPVGISGSNIVGNYFDSTYHTHGFIYDGTTYTSIDAPNSSETTVTAISGGNVVGWSTASASYTNNAFLYHQGSFTALIVPTSLGDLKEHSNGSIYYLYVRMSSLARRVRRS